MKKIGYIDVHCHLTNEQEYAAAGGTEAVIAAAKNAGADTLCVLSGEVKIAEVNAAQGAEKPTYVLDHVNRLLPFL